MRRVRYGGAISLDGYIAGPNGEADWITMDPDIDFAAMFAQYDTMLIGRRTFTAMGPGADGSMPGMAVYVFSTTLRQEDHPNVTIVGSGAADLVRRLREQPGKDIALVNMLRRISPEQETNRGSRAPARRRRASPTG